MPEVCAEISTGLFTAREAVLVKMKDYLHKEEKASYWGQTRFVILGYGREGKGEICLKIADEISTGYVLRMCTLSSRHLDIANDVRAERSWCACRLLIVKV